MEYNHLSYAGLGIICFILWSLDFWKLSYPLNLVLPAGEYSQKKNFKKIGIYLVGMIGFFLMSYSLTGPRKALKFIPSDVEVNDIFLVVDVSRSMLADDLRPNRLEVAKEKLREFALLRPTDRFGVIIFSEKIFTLLPLTTDPALVDQILSDIKIGYLGSGTNIGDALALAVGRGQDSETKNKVIILLTDGVSNMGTVTPMSAAKIAKDFDMKVYTIGLGSENSRLPIGKDFNGQQRYQSIPGGSIDTKTLKDISALTGGKYFMASSEKSLEKILSEIQKLEKTKINNDGQVAYDELFFIYLLWGVLLFILSELLKKFVLKEVL